MERAIELHPVEQQLTAHPQNGDAIENRPLGQQPVPQQQNGEVIQPIHRPNQRRRNALSEIDNAPYSGFHRKICLVTGIGFFTDAYDIFAITMAAEMLNTVYGLSVWQSAGLKMATPVGNLIGQLLFGVLADIVGRKRMYGVELIIMIIATFGQAVSGAGPYLSIVGILIFWRVIMGIGVGGDYPLSAIIASEFASTEIRGRLMTAVFSFQGWGQLFASLVGMIVTAALKDKIAHQSGAIDLAWRLLIGIGCIPASFVVYFRLTVPESPRFTADVACRVGQAERDIRIGLQHEGFGIFDEQVIEEQRIIVPQASWSDFVDHFSKLDNFKVLFATAYSWFALDVSFYILTLDYEPILNLVFHFNSSDTYQNLYTLCAVSAILAVAGLLPGFLAAFLLIDSWGRKPIQVMGFVVLTVLFWIMSFDYSKLVPGSTSAARPAFMVLYCLANFFQNFGPNTTTFIIPGEVFPTRYRSTAHGISAACGKLGAVIALILFTLSQQQNVQVSTVLIVLSFVMMTGVFSSLLIPETKKKTLETLSNEDQENFVRDPA